MILWTAGIDDNGAELWRRRDGVTVRRDMHQKFVAVLPSGELFRHPSKSRVPGKLKKWTSGRVAKYEIDFLLPCKGSST